MLCPLVPPKALRTMARPDVAGIGCIQHANPASNMKHQEHCLIILSSFPCLFDLDVGLSPKMHFHREATPATAHQSCWHCCVLVPVNGLAKLPHGIRSKMVYIASQYAKKGDNHRLADKHALCKSFYMCLHLGSNCTFKIPAIDMMISIMI